MLTPRLSVSSLTVPRIYSFISSSVKLFLIRQTRFLGRRKQLPILFPGPLLPVSPYSCASCFRYEDKIILKWRFTRDSVIKNKGSFIFVNCDLQPLGGGGMDLGRENCVVIRKRRTIFIKFPIFCYQAIFVSLLARNQTSFHNLFTTCILTFHEINKEKSSLHLV